MKVEVIARCDRCQKAHQIVSRAPDKVQSAEFICRCGNKINAAYDTNSWSFSNATISERKEGEPAFIHEPELS